MVKNTVRFHEGVVEEIESLVDEGVLESKSEFYRFASEYVLARIADGYEPHMVDYESVKTDLLSEPAIIDPSTTSEPTDGIPFLESVAIIRRFALRGDLQDAEDFIDHHYEAGERDALLLEELLGLYRGTPIGTLER